jgi:hypothetical protein
MKKLLIALSLVLSTATLAIGESSQSFRLQAVPAALVISANASDEFTVRKISNGAGAAPQGGYQGGEPEDFRYCLVAGDTCYEVPTSTQSFGGQRASVFHSNSERFVTVRVPKSVMKALAKATASLPQGVSLPTVVKVLSRSGDFITDLPFQLYGQIKNSAFRLRSPAKAARRKKAKTKTNLIVAKDLGGSSQRPSRSYRSPSGFNGEGCGGLDAVFSSYKKYLDCADQAVTSCTQTNAFEKAFCIIQQCRNTPDQFEGFWRDVNGDSSSTGNQYYKNNFGSEAIASDEFDAVLHPCLYDGAGKFISKFNASAVVMGDVYPLVSGFLQVFHPAREENSNLSRGDARLGFNGQILTRIIRDDFGATTVPFTFQQELFKSFPQTTEGTDKVYWVNKVIPVYMYFRPQGVIGIELEARVSPESRFLEINFKSYNDFGTSADTGPALNADDKGMLPSLAELNQLEFWPARGGFGPICAQWFQSSTTHPIVARQCSTQVDFGTIATRAGTVSTSREGKDRIVYYRDYSQGGDDGTLVAFPWRNPVLSDE